jgi:hypothetical protein
MSNVSELGTFPGCGLPPFQYHAEELLAFKMWHQPLIANIGDSFNAGAWGDGDGRLLPASGPRQSPNKQMAFLPVENWVNIPASEPYSKWGERLSFLQLFQAFRGECLSNLNFEVKIFD